ncbi:MAG: HAMP domain-containing sensor histidine kinase [Acidimicrobiia bacterium]
MPAIFRSIRFRLSVQYSAVVFGLGGALLGLVYLALRRWLETQTMTQFMWTGRPVFQNGVQIGVIPALEAHEMRMIESIYNQIVLNEVARFTLFALALLFLLSLVVGWVMSGRVLKPVEEITQVARDIQASDLSRRIALEGPDDELTRLASTFDDMLGRLDQAFSSQRQFLADTSHDLRTPLSVIRSNVEVVAGDEEAQVEDWKEVGGIVQRNVEKMSHMIDGLLATARLQTGKAQAVTLDLAALVTEKATEFASLVSQRGVTMETAASPAVVQGVEVALDRALTNLMDNALRVAPTGSSIRVGSGVQDGWAWLAVQDSGPGLPDEPDGGRVGLGLSIVEQVAAAHGGVLVDLPGDGGKGVIMIIWLPIDEPENSHPAVSPFTNP